MRRRGSTAAGAGSRSAAASVRPVGTPARASRGDAKDLGETLEAGEASLLVIGESRVAEQLNKATARAEKAIEKEVDADSQELARDLEEAEKELAEQAVPASWTRRLAPRASPCDGRSSGRPSLLRWT